VKSIARARSRLLVLILGFCLVGCASSGGPEPPSPSASGAQATTPGYVRDLVAADFHAYLQQKPDAFVIDTRLSMEWNDDYGHLDNAIQIPLEDLETRLGDLPTDKNRPIAVYDQLEVRSSTVAHRIAQLGYREVVTLAGGLVAYRRAGF